MGCCGDREKLEDARDEQKWSCINLRDFTSTSWLSRLSYVILYVFILISGAVYAVDCFTAVNLLFFNRWSGQVKPVISFKIARWIFAACILFSLVLLVYRWFRALRVIKSGVIAASYLDPLAVRINCVRAGAMGHGWRRFLVFAALTEGRKGAEYVALFSYFSFEAWMRIIFAQGPRQLLNAQTLYSVMQADLVPAGDHAAKDGHSAIAQFWINLQILANHNEEQAAILFGMLFTLTIWVFSVISLLLACIFYVTFLWHHIPRKDGSLSRYCRRKIDTRLSKIVSLKVNKALAKEDELRVGEAAGAFKKDRPPQAKRQPTLPIIDDDGHSSVSSDLNRQSSQESSSNGSSRYPSGPTIFDLQPTVADFPSFTVRPDAPSRSTTQSSAHSSDSYGSDAPLMGAAGAMGYGPYRNFSKPPPSWSAPERSTPYGYPPMSRKSTSTSQDSQHSYHTAYSSGPVAGRSTPVGPPLSRQNSDYNDGAALLPLQRTHTPVSSIGAVSSIQEYELRTQSPFSIPRMPSRSQYIAYNPQIQRPATAAPPTRNLTAPHRIQSSHHFSRLHPPQRSGTAPPPHTSSDRPLTLQAETRDNFTLDNYAPTPRPSVPSRPATAEPYEAWNGKKLPNVPH